MKKGMLTRIIVGTILTAVFAGLWLSFRWRTFGIVLQTVIFSIIAILCVHEMITVLKKSKVQCKIFTAPLYILAAVSSPLIMFYEHDSLYALFFIFAVLTIYTRLSDKNARNEDMFGALAVYVYPLALLTSLFNLCYLGGTKMPEMNRLAMFIVFACPLAGDTLAYFFGVTMGKRKLCEHISPKKTLAGSIGSVIGSMLAALGAFYLQNALPVIFNITDSMPPIVKLFPLLTLGLVLGIVGQIGDLFASCVKRWAGVKDYGSIFPGHGGMMDRIDSVMLCAPFVLMFFTIFENYIY